MSESVSVEYSDSPATRPTTMSWASCRCRPNLRGNAAVLSATAAANHACSASVCRRALAAVEARM
ncbi:hypothetical protein WK41_22155 [Burkholderia cepacia]|nr:hypothetical protein WK41_22155 [Burkholderia cepacia]